MSYHKSVVRRRGVRTTRQTFPNQLCKVCKVNPTDYMPSFRGGHVHRHLPARVQWKRPPHGGHARQLVGLARQAPSDTPPPKEACINLDAILTEGYHIATRGRGAAT